MSLVYKDARAFSFESQLETNSKMRTFLIASLLPVLLGLALGSPKVDIDAIVAQARKEVLENLPEPNARRKANKL